MICTVLDTEFTRGSPFGEQWWKVVEPNGTKHSFAMWLNANNAERWPRTGDTVKLKRLDDKKCCTGGGGAIICSPCADLVEIVKRADNP